MRLWDRGGSDLILASEPVIGLRSSRAGKAKTVSGALSGYASRLHEVGSDCLALPQAERVEKELRDPANGSH